jgi:hypothetical protein
MKDGTITLRTVVDLSRAQQEMIGKTSDRLGIDRSEVNDTSVDSLEDSLRAVVDDRFDSQAVISWVREQVETSIRETVAAHQLKAIQEGDNPYHPLADQLDDLPIDAQLACLIQQLPYILYMGYLIGQRDEKAISSPTPVTGAALTLSMDKVLGGSGTWADSTDPERVDKTLDALADNLSNHLTEDGADWVADFYEKVAKDARVRMFFSIGLATGLDAMKGASDARG